jgi:diaminohydroxyphosphoribosylaminopyrimidine deaminase/5-amino-6-(5-phosphoribosylamino)uracil reductase
LGALAQSGITRVFCEGGGMLAAGLLQAGLVDELVHFSAGRMIGAEGQPMIGALGVDRLKDAPRFDLVEQRKVGMDIQSTWRANSRR